MDDGAAGAVGSPGTTLVERLKALAVQAPSHDGALAAVTRALCESEGARVCTVHRLGTDGRALHLVGGHALDAVGGDAQLEALRIRPAEDPLLGTALAEGRQIARVEGVSGLVATPFDMGVERCVLLFAGIPAAISKAPVLAAAVAALAPLLALLKEDERARLHRRALEAGAEAVMVTEAKGEDERIVYVNPAFTTLTGFGAAEVLDTNPRLLRWLGAPFEGWQAMRDAMRRQEPLREDVIYRHRNGMPVWVDMSLAPIRDAEGRCTHFVSMLRDITREREATASLAESEAAFRSLYERNPIPMWIYDQRTFAFVSVNDAAVEDYGWPREQFLRMKVTDIQAPEDRRAMNELAAPPGRDRTVSGPWRHVTAAGREKLVQTSAYLTEFGGRRAVLLAAWDVTAQVRFERELRLSRAALQRQAVELRHTQRLARLGTWRWPVGGGAPSWSEEVHALVGTDPLAPPATREATLALVHPDDREALDAAITRVAETGRQETFEFRVARADGRIVHCRGEGYLEPGQDGAEGAVAGYVQDVTEQREAEAALRQADRMTTLGQLTGGIAHDFNNLLTVASVSLEMAADAAAEGRAAPELIRSARAALDRGARLTSQLLSFARRQPLQPQALDLARVLPGLIELMQRSIGERHPIHLDAEGGLGVSADPAQLEAAMLNLVLNARDAMPAGGAITIRTRLLDATIAGAPLLGDLAPGRYVTIAVGDTGTGMPPDVKARIFEPFFTTKPAGVGTGLGLSMVLGFAKQSGGDVVADSAPGRGTTMTLCLPAVEAGAEAGPRGEAEVASLPPDLDVLVVEDQPDVRAAAIRMCTAAGLQPMAVASAEEALRVLRSGLRFDALFTDAVLGGAMDGLDLAAAALAEQPGLAVVCTSGTMDDELGRRGRRVPRLEMLPKPYDSRGFQAALLRALQAARAHLDPGG